jgi:hypothetical protein
MPVLDSTGIERAPAASAVAMKGDVGMPSIEA